MKLDNLHQLPDLTHLQFKATGARPTKGGPRSRSFLAQRAHDPLDYKLRPIGRYAQEAALPDATIYGSAYRFAHSFVDMRWPQAL